ncbi:MAG: hypothetical protein IPG89_08225 [Bacteroidetes bacterium]|nr:hypothetical protein [Bacteroidota bacterium]
MDFIIEQIDWNKVAEFILGKDHTDIQAWIITQKSSMTKRLSLIKELEIPLLICDIWEIRYTASPEPIFEIKFIPIEFTAHNNSQNINIDQEKIDEREWKFLHQLLQVYSENQEYEKCHLLKVRLQDMIEEKG